MSFKSILYIVTYLVVASTIGIVSIQLMNVYAQSAAVTGGSGSDTAGSASSSNQLAGASSASSSGKTTDCTADSSGFSLGPPSIGIKFGSATDNCKSSSQDDPLTK